MNVLNFDDNCKRKLDETYLIIYVIENTINIKIDTYKIANNYQFLLIFKKSKFRKNREILTEFT